MAALRRRPPSLPIEDIGIRLDRNAETSLFTQVREQIADLIHEGVLQPGTRLPPVRTLARELGVNQITIARAYRELAVLRLAEGRGGGGTFVRAPMHGLPSSRHSRPVAGPPLLADRLFELSRAPGVIAFTSNYPLMDPAIVEEYCACMRLVLEEDSASCFQYDPPIGRPSARAAVSDYLAARGINVHPEHIVMTSGAQQGIDLTLRSHVPPGGVVIVERPTYYGALNLLRMANAQIIEVPMEPDGMNLDALASALSRQRVSLLYTNPTFQNPTGITTSEAKRREILALTRRHGVPVLEDDHASEWRFAGQAVPAYAALAGDDDRVFYANSVGKMMLPGQRIGFLVVPPGERDSILPSKVSVDLHGNAIAQEAFARFLSRGRFVPLLERMRQAYAERQRLLITELERRMPAGTQISRPDGGLSLWIGLPKNADMSELYFRAVRRGVAFLSGETFFSARPEGHLMRVSFGLVPEESLLEGIARLSVVVSDLLVTRTRPAIFPT